MTKAVRVDELINIIERVATQYGYDTSTEEFEEQYGIIYGMDREELMRVLFDILDESLDE